jgi:hypothetical protein
MHALNMEKIPDTDFLVEQDMKAPRTEEITSCVQQESCQQVKGMDVSESVEYILYRNL